MKKSIGITDFLARKFDTYPFDGPWKLSFSEPEKNFRMIVFGHPGNGKTEFAMQLAKQMAQYTRVYYNSTEQGISKSLQDALIRNRMEEVSGRVLFGDGDSYEEMMARISKPRSAQAVIIDSRDYLNLTTQQFKQMIDLHPRKAFIILCWEANGKPKGEYGKAIEYMCDIKVNVRNFRAYPRCRFGGNVPYTIWDRKEKTTTPTLF